MDNESDHERRPAETPPDASSSPPSPEQPAGPGAGTPTPSATAATPAPQDVPPHTHEPEGSRWAFWAKLAALLFFVGYAIAFIVGNDKSISVDFVFATGRVSL